MNPRKTRICKRKVAQQQITRNEWIFYEQRDPTQPWSPPPSDTTDEENDEEFSDESSNPTDDPSTSTPLSTSTSTSSSTKKLWTFDQYELIDNLTMLKRRFPAVNDVNIENLRITKEGLYSITRPSDANTITEFIRTHLGDLSQLVITDGTANVGGNVINFAQHFLYVQAVEWAKPTCDILRHNIEQYGFNNVDIIQEDYTRIYPILHQDVIFLDPPWGGQGYLTQERINLSLSTMTISHLVNSLKGLTKLVVLKVPDNFNYTRFKREMNYEKVFRYRIYNYRLILLLPKYTPKISSSSEILLT